MRLGSIATYRLGLLFVLITSTQAAQAQAIFEMPEGVESRWASGENPKGEWGAEGCADGGDQGGGESCAGGGCGDERDGA